MFDFLRFSWLGELIRADIAFQIYLLQMMYNNK